MFRWRQAAMVAVSARRTVSQTSVTDPLRHASRAEGSDSPASFPSSQSPASTASSGGVEPQQAATSTRVAQGRQGHYNAAYHQRLQRQRQSDRRQRRRGTTFQGDDEREGNMSAADSTVPMVHPGAHNLPPLQELAPKKPKFSFLADASQRKERDYWIHGETPNNTPPPLLPMWASSLTSPALGKQRLVVDNWISMDSQGTVSEALTQRFIAWISRDNSTLAAQLSENVELHLRRSFQRGVYARRDLHAGEILLTIPLASAVGDREENEDSARAPSWATALNAETLSQHSYAARDRVVPSYNDVKNTLASLKSSDFDPIPHPLFVDQVHSALLLACERAEGENSALYPYLRLFEKSQVPLGNTATAEDEAAAETPLIDDEQVRELHLGVLDPVTHMEYNDHRYRFTHYLRKLHSVWWDAYETERKRRLRSRKQTGVQELKPDSETEKNSDEVSFKPVLQRRSAQESAVESLSFAPRNDTQTLKHEQEDRAESVSDENSLTDPSFPFSDDDTLGLKAPPTLADMEWSFRFVLSRQRILPGLRHRTDDLAKECTEAKYEEVAEKLDPFAKTVMKGKWAFYERVLRVVDEERRRVNDYDPSSIATVVPLLDMFNHPPGGRPNVDFSIEFLSVKAPRPAEEEHGAREDTVPPKDDHATAVVPHIVVRTTESVEALDELTLLFPKCYSVSYSLYRFGFLPLRTREDDMTDLMKANRVNGELRHASSEKETNQQGVFRRLLHRVLDVPKNADGETKNARLTDGKRYSSH